MSEVNASADSSVESAGAEGAESSSENANLLADVELTEEELNAEAEELEKEIQKELRKKYKAKVYGQEKEVELDLNNDEEVLKYIQKAMAADEKFREASTLKKQMESLVEALRQDPRAVLSHPGIGLDLKQFAAQILNEALEEEAKSPEQKERERIMKELQEKDNKLKELERRAQQAELARIEEQEFRQLDAEINEALNSMTDLPKSPYVVKRITDLMIDAVNAGYVDVKVSDVVPVVRQRLRAELQGMFELMPEDVLEEVVGKNNLNRLRKKRLTRTKKPVETASSVKDSGQKEANKKSSKSDDAQKKATFSQLFGNF